LIVRILELTL